MYKEKEKNSLPIKLSTCERLCLPSIEDFSIWSGKENNPALVSFAFTPSLPCLSTRPFPHTLIRYRSETGWYGDGN